MRKRLVLVLALTAMVFASSPKGVGPRLYFVDGSLFSVWVKGDEIAFDSDSGRPVVNPRKKDQKFRLSVDSKEFVVTSADEMESQTWMKKNDQKGRLSIKDGDLYVDGKVIDLKGAEVTEIYEAIPWGKGILCHGRTYKKKSKERVRSLKDLLAVSPEDIEPYCAIWINTETHTGSSRYLYGKVRRRLMVFPVPRG